MDTLDWALIRELCGNSRTPYKTLATKLNVSTNTVKNHINRLREKGVIVKFGICVSFETLGAEMVSGFITTDGSEDVIELMKQIASQPVVCDICRNADRRYEYWAMVKGANETLGLKHFLTSLDCARDVQIQPIELFYPNKPPTYLGNTRGKKVIFSRDQLRVLRCLTNDSRLPISQIASKTGFTPRRVRKILHDLQESGGIHTYALYNLFELGDLEYRLRIRYDDAQITGREVVMALYKKHPEVFLWSTITTNEPIVDVGLIIDRPGKGPPIAAEMKAAPYIKSVEDFVTYPRVVNAINRLSGHLFELLREAGL
ncbi:MAG: winged helix-turn-helix transcriptional regulator [Candidatus Thorarchaeota archaeon]